MTIRCTIVEFIPLHFIRTYLRPSYIIQYNFSFSALSFALETRTRTTTQNIYHLLAYHFFFSISQHIYSYPFQYQINSIIIFILLTHEKSLVSNNMALKNQIISYFCKGSQFFILHSIIPFWKWTSTLQRSCTYVSLWSNEKHHMMNKFIVFKMANQKVPNWLHFIFDTHTVLLLLV